jgi:Flp pilus assembly protein TadG
MSIRVTIPGAAAAATVSAQGAAGSRRGRARCRPCRPAVVHPRRWRGVLGDETGGPTVELALATPILLLLLAGFVDLGMYGCARVMLEGSLREVARYGITGQIPDDSDRIAHMRQMIANATYGLVNPDAIVLSIRSYPTFEDVGQGEDFIDTNENGAYDPGETFRDCNGNGIRDEDRGAEGTGGSAQVVVYQIDYDWGLWTTMLAPLMGHNGKLHIRASTVVRNEPWDPDAANSTPESCAL